MGKSDPTIGFPVVISCNDEKPIFHPFHCIINYLDLNNTPPNFKIKKSCCDVIISLFLFQISRLIKENFYTIINLLFRNLRECLNMHGYDTILDYLNKNHKDKIDTVAKRKKEGKLFCQTETCEFIPLISEKFILEYLPQHCPDFEQKIAIDTMYDFCNWLTKNQLSRVKVRFGDDTVNLKKKNPYLIDIVILIRGHQSFYL